MVGSKEGKLSVDRAASFAYGAGATGILANLFLIAFYALQASQPENGTWLGSATWRHDHTREERAQRSHSARASESYSPKLAADLFPRGVREIVALWSGVVTAMTRQQGRVGRISYRTAAWLAWSLCALSADRCADRLAPPGKPRWLARVALRLRHQREPLQRRVRHLCPAGTT